MGRREKALLRIGEGTKRGKMGMQPKLFLTKAQKTE